MSVFVEMRRGFTVSDMETGLVPTNLEAHSNLVLAELYKLETDDLTDVTVSVDLSKGLVEFEVYGRGDSFDETVEMCDAAIRAAIHAAGGHTPEWRGYRSSAELVDA